MLFPPGHAGARNCKFLERVTVTAHACKDDANWKQYAVHAPDVPLRKIAEFVKYKTELLEDPPVQEMPVQSMITSPSPNDIIAAAKSGGKYIAVKGIAWGGGGSGVNRVDVSLDNGQTFTRADMLDKPIEERRTQRQVCRPRICQRNTTRRAVEQLYTERVFQIGHVLADQTRGSSHALSCDGEGGVFCDERKRTHAVNLVHAIAPFQGLI